MIGTVLRSLLGRSEQDLPDETYLELVRSLFSARLLTFIIGVSFVGIGLVIRQETHDALLDMLILGGSLIAMLRLFIILVSLRRLSFARAELGRVTTWEQRFAGGSFLFAATLGALGARTFIVSTPVAHMLMIGLLFGYTSGLVARSYFRPWICIPSMLIATVPIIIAVFARGSVAYFALGLLLTLFVSGGIESSTYIYANAREQITLRRQFAVVARKDDLTGLTNRLGLREQFDDVSRHTQAGTFTAVHCLDLDRFKSVNDQLGHQVGDGLLKAVSQRLSRQLRAGDIVARIGGDEFVVVQSGVAGAIDAEALAWRIARAISVPYMVKGHTLSIGTSVGIALAPGDELRLDVLISRADAALYKSKRSGLVVTVAVEHDDASSSEGA